MQKLSNVSFLAKFDLRIMNLLEVSLGKLFPVVRLVLRIGNSKSCPRQILLLLSQHQMFTLLHLVAHSSFLLCWHVVVPYAQRPLMR